MKIVCKVNKEKDIYQLSNADAYLLANKQFSYRYDESFSLTKILKIKRYCKKNNKEVYILVNKIFKDADLSSLKEFLSKLKEIKVDGIYFTDFAVFMLAKELKMEHLCVFYHETFLRNSYDIVTYQEYGISKIVCSKDMNIEDIVNLPKDRKESYGIICFGYIPMYESQRKIISNYVNLNNLPKDVIKSKTLTLKENTRDEFYKVIEQDGVASIFNNKVLNYLPHLDKLLENINTFIVDSLFFETSFIYDVIEAFKYNGEIKAENIEFTEGFLTSRIGLM